jgi:hypothetical protein
VLTKFRDKLGSNEASATDHYDFHDFAPFISGFPSSAGRTR